MAQVSARLRSAKGGFIHWCPGCQEAHFIPTEAAATPRPIWTFDGDLDAPTFSPSVRIAYSGADAGKIDADGFRAPPACCHYFLRAGQLQFCADSTHAFSGQTVPLPPLPPNLSDKDAAP